MWFQSSEDDRALSCIRRYIYVFGHGKTRRDADLQDGNLEYPAILQIRVPAGIRLFDEDFDLFAVVVVGDFYDLAGLSGADSGDDFVEGAVV